MCIIKINNYTIVETIRQMFWRQCKHVNVESEFFESIHEIYGYGIF